MLGDAHNIADIANIANSAWINNLVGFYRAGNLLGVNDVVQVQRVPQAVMPQPAVQRGRRLPQRPATGW